MKLGGGNQDCLVPLHITLIAPDDLHTLEIDEDFKVEDYDQQHCHLFNNIIMHHYFQCSAKDFGVFHRVTTLAQEGR